MLLGKLSLSPARATYPFLVRIKASDMRLGSMQRWKQYDHERVGCAENMEKPGFFEKYVFPFVGTGVRTRERGHRRKRKDVSQSLEG